MDAIVGIFTRLGDILASGDDSEEDFLPAEEEELAPEPALLEGGGRHAEAELGHYANFFIPAADEARFYSDGEPYDSDDSDSDEFSDETFHNFERLHALIGDLSQMQAIVYVCGPPGSGKSSLLKQIEAEATKVRIQTQGIPFPPEDSDEDSGATAAPLGARTQEESAIADAYREITNLRNASLADRTLPFLLARSAFWCDNFLVRYSFRPRLVIAEGSPHDTANVEIPLARTQAQVGKAEAAILASHAAQAAGFILSTVGSAPRGPLSFFVYLDATPATCHARLKARCESRPDLVTPAYSIDDLRRSRTEFQSQGVAHAQTATPNTVLVFSNTESTDLRGLAEEVVEEVSKRFISWKREFFFAKCEELGFEPPLGPEHHWGLSNNARQHSPDLDSGSALKED